MTRLRNSIVLLSMVAMLGGCQTVKGIFKGKGALPAEQPSAVCAETTEPPRVPIKNVTFFALPEGQQTIDGGVQIVAGITAEGIADFLANMNGLQKRETQWQGRIAAGNECLRKEAAQRLEAEKKVAKASK